MFLGSRARSVRRTGTFFYREKFHETYKKVSSHNLSVSLRNISHALSHKASCAVPPPFTIMYSRCTVTGPPTAHRSYCTPHSWVMNLLRLVEIWIHTPRRYCTPHSWVMNLLCVWSRYGYTHRGLQARGNFCLHGRPFTSPPSYGPSSS
jgi:hypothetical protein